MSINLVPSAPLDHGGSNLVCRWLIQQLSEDVSVTMTVTLGLGQRVKPQPAIALRVSRNVEEIIADVEGPAKILYWLKILGVGIVIQTDEASSLMQ